jgi:predicted nucleic acid-binding protein
MKSNPKNKYLFDTNIYGLLLTNKSPQLNKFIFTLDQVDIVVSCFVMAELEVLRFSVFDPELFDLLHNMETSKLIWFNQNHLETFAKLKHEMSVKRIRNRTIDWFIAAQCLNEDYILVTSNVKDYEHIPNLKTKFFDQKNSRWY